MPRDVSGTKAASRSTTQEAAAPVRPKAGDDLDQTDGGGGGKLSPTSDDKIYRAWQVAVA